MTFLTPSRLILLALTLGVIMLVFNSMIPDTQDRVAVEQTTGTLLEVHLNDATSNANSLLPSLGLIELEDGSQTRLPLGNNPPPPGTVLDLEVWIYSDGERRYRLRQP